MTKVLLLDVMGTAVYDPFFREVPEFFGMSFAELLRSKHPHSWLDFEFGRCDEATFLKNFFSDGRAYDEEGLKQSMFQAYRWLADMEECLADLKAKDWPMHWVSNYSCWYQEIDARLGLSRYAPFSFVSCNWGLRKPDPEVFRRLGTDLALEPEHCLFVDDAKTNCDAAAACGFAVHQFRGVEGFKESLSQHGIF